MATSTDEMLQSLESYNIQLDTVETALTTDPTNEELLILRNDLQEVINLTKDLISNAEPSKKKDKSGDHTSKTSEPVKWSVGDNCSAMSSEDGRYHKAKIDQIEDDGKVNVTFEETGNSDITEILLLKVIAHDKNTAASSGVQQSLPYAATSGQQAGDKAMTKKEKMLAEREYKRKKTQKKRERLEKLEAQKEEEKNKWLQFSQKNMMKSKRAGKLKRSIFASPESVSGRVGIGTCGTADRPMTGNPSGDKHRMYKPQM